MSKGAIRNVVFMGTPDFALGSLNALIDGGYHVQAVFTQPDKPKGRSGKAAMPPVKEAALEKGIPVYQPRRIREPENEAILRNLNPDVIVVTAFGQIIPQAILDIPPYGCVNVHASLLPKYRGAAPIQWAIIDGEKETGVTTMQMNAGLDTGDILLRQTVPIADDETGGSLFDKLSEIGGGLLQKTLKELEQGTIVPEKQPEESPTAYAAMLDRKTGLLDFSEPAETLERKIRGLNPWPSAFTTMNGKTLKIWSADVLTENEFERRYPASGEDGAEMTGQKSGALLVSSDGKMIVRTGEGFLELDEVQLEGKKRLKSDAFLRGLRLGGDRILYLGQ